MFYDFIPQEKEKKSFFLMKFLAKEFKPNLEIKNSNWFRFILLDAKIQRPKAVATNCGSFIGQLMRCIKVIICV
jgi:hypothetical protein